MRDAVASGRRILVVGPLPPPRHGVSELTRVLLESDLRRRYDLLHLDTADRRGVANIGRFDAGNVTLAAIHGARFLGMLARARPDAVYLPVSKNTLGFMRDALFMAPTALWRTPLILHFHGAGFDDFAGSTALPVRRLVRMLLPHAACAIVLGEALRPMLRGLVPESRIAAVPNGVPEPLNGAAAARSEGESMRILFLGNLLPGKGYVELLQAVEALLDEGIPVSATFAGDVADGPGFTRARAAIRHGERVRFTGPVDAAAKADLLADADVLVLPSEDEAQPLVILEAMAAGLPVVSTHRGAIPETVVDGVTGVLVEPRDAVALTDALRALARDGTRRLALGAAGRERYLKHYTVRRWAERISNVFDSVIAGASP